MDVSANLRRTATAMATVGVLASGSVCAAASAPASPLDSPAVICSWVDVHLLGQASWQNGNETRVIQLLEDSTRCVQAYEYNGQPGDSLWVWNKTDGAKSSFTIRSGQHDGLTDWINDKNMLSHACMRPHLSNGTTGPKTCTGFH